MTARFAPGVMAGAEAGRPVVSPGAGNSPVHGGSGASAKRPVAAGPELIVDWTRCDGHGLCAALLPRSIGRDDWGYPTIDNAKVAVERRSAVKRAVGACPALALRLA